MARDDSVLAIGDRVELTRENDRVYRTKVEDIPGGRAYLVGVPSSGRIPMALHLYDDVTVAFYRESGRYFAPARVLNIESRDGILYALLFLKSKPRRDQRRDAFRVPVRLRVVICSQKEEEGVAAETYGTAPPEAVGTTHIYLPGDGTAARQASAPPPSGTINSETLESVGSRDISLSGIGLITKKTYPSGEHYLLKLHLNNPRENEPLQIRASVVRATPGMERNTYDIGMKFYGKTNSIDILLSKYMFNQQQRQLKLKRLSGEMSES